MDLLLFVCGSERIQSENRTQSTSSGSTSRQPAQGGEKSNERKYPANHRKRAASYSSDSSSSSSTSSSSSSDSDRPYFVDPKREKERVKKLKKSRKLSRKERKKFETERHNTNG